MSRFASIQQVHLDVNSIEEGVLCLSGGRYRAVLEVSSVNFALQGEVERESTVAGFAAFLNALSFPVQILVRVLPIDFEAYLVELERRALEFPWDLADLARDHVAFLRRLARSRTLLERRFYLVVPAQEGPHLAVYRRNWPFGRQSPNINSAAARKQLTFRCDEVERQLLRCGLTARRLASSQLAQLLYDCWCPELARVQRVRRDLAEYTAPVIQGPRAEGPALGGRKGLPTQSPALSPLSSAGRRP